MKSVKMNLKEAIQDQLGMAQIFKNAGKIEEAKGVIEDLAEIVRQNKNCSYYIENKGKVEHVMARVCKMVGVKW